MAGVVTVVLSDDEVNRLIQWGTWYPTDGKANEADIALYRKLQGYKMALACPVKR